MPEIQPGLYVITEDQTLEFEELVEKLRSF